MPTEVLEYRGYFFCTSSIDESRIVANHVIDVTDQCTMNDATGLRFLILYAHTPEGDIYVLYGIAKNGNVICTGPLRKLGELYRNRLEEPVRHNGKVVEEVALNSFYQRQLARHGLSTDTFVALVREHAPEPRQPPLSSNTTIPPNGGACV